MAIERVSCQSTHITETHAAVRSNWKYRHSYYWFCVIVFAYKFYISWFQTCNIIFIQTDKYVGYFEDILL